MKPTKTTLMKWKREAISFRDDIKDMEGIEPTTEILDRLILVIQTLYAKKREPSLLRKLNKLNDLCEGTLCITHITDWEIRSYGKNTLLCCKHSDCVNALSLEECIDKALKIVEEAKK